MTTRLDLALQRHPEHEAGIRLLAERDPSGNLKYLDWAARMLAAGQALAPEIVDVLDLYHRFTGQGLDERPAGARARPRIGRPLVVHPDIYHYRPQDLADLRTLLGKMKRARDRKQKKREQLYRIEGAVEATVVWESPALVVRHVQNKAASVHYGGSTKWCISMLREGYFEDYDARNAIFFFFERKAPVGDEFDKVALMVPRGAWAQGENDFVAFTATDQRVGMMSLARAYGVQFFDILQRVAECSDRYPGSAVAQVYAGTASAEQLAAVFAHVETSVVGEYDAIALLEAIACNDAAPWSLLEQLAERSTELLLSAHKRVRRTHLSRRRRRRHRVWMISLRSVTQAFAKTITAALAIHPEVPAPVREQFVRKLRRRRIAIEHVRRTNCGYRIGVSYDVPIRNNSHKRLASRHRRPSTVSQLRKRAEMFDRAAKRTRKKARTLARKLAVKAEKKERRPVPKKAKR